MARGWGALRTAGARPSAMGPCIALIESPAVARPLTTSLPPLPASARPLTNAQELHTDASGAQPAGSAEQLLPDPPQATSRGANPCAAPLERQAADTAAESMLLPHPAHSSRVCSHQGASTSCRAPEQPRGRPACQATRSPEARASSGAAEAPVVSTGGPLTAQGPGRLRLVAG